MKVKGNPEEVREEVKKRIEDLAPRRGFVFSTVRNVQSDIPHEYYMAMREIVQDYGNSGFHVIHNNGSDEKGVIWR